MSIYAKNMAHLKKNACPLWFKNATHCTLAKLKGHLPVGEKRVK